MITSNSLDKIKFSVLDGIMKTLFVAERRRLAKNVDKLHDLNQEVSKASLDGFTYQGKFYRHSASAAGGGKRQTLHLSLWPDMQAHLADEAQVDLDEQLIRQVLARQLGHCMKYEELRDAVPDCIADTLPPDLAQRERSYNVSFFARHPRDIRQFADALPRIEFYSAARLLY